MAGNLLTVSDADFDEVVKGSDKPVLVDFWAEWCGPCKMIAPVLEEIAGERDDLTIAKLDIDANPQTTNRFSVMSIPTLILFVDGAPKARVVGAKGKSALLGELAGHLS